MVDTAPASIAPVLVGTRPGFARSPDGRFLRYVALSFMALLFLYPLYWTITSAFKPAGDILAEPLAFNPFTATLSNFRAVFSTIPAWRGFLNTFIVILGSGGLTLIFAPLAGFGFAKYRFVARNFLFGVLLLTLMLPVLVLVIPLLIEMAQIGWINTYMALIFPGSVSAFAVFWMRQTTAALP